RSSRWSSSSPLSWASASSSSSSRSSSANSSTRCRHDCSRSRCARGRWKSSSCSGRSGNARSSRSSRACRAWSPASTRRTRRARGSQLLEQLPDALDLLTISVEAGLGFDAALVKVTEKLKGALSEEFKRAGAEQRVGKSRQEALRGISERVDVKELQSFISAIIQADQLGVSMSKVLRIQSETLRTERRQRAEEKAARAPILIMLPTVGCIFPSLFIVILAPAALSAMKSCGSVQGR